jgi:acetyl esterase/lipase
VLVVAFPIFTQAQSFTPAEWVDYASGEYNISPNITYATANNTPLKLDLYLPKQHDKPLPTSALFHEGGWVAEQKECNMFQLLHYLSFGRAVLNVEYRIASNSPAPAAVEDSRCALRWVAAHTKEYNFDVYKERA